MHVGLIGIKFTGKTTLFNAVSGMELPTGQGGVEPNRAVCNVPDRRLDHLFEILAPKRQVPAQVEWVDIPGFEPGAAADGGREATRFLEHGRKVDVLAQVVRCFDGGYGPANPARELETVALELALADLQIVENRLERLAADRQKIGKLEHPFEPDLMERFRTQLENDRPLRELEIGQEEARVVSGFSFLTRKPLIVVLNHEEDGNVTDLLDRARLMGPEVVPLCARMEAELAELQAEDAAAFLDELGIEEPAVHRMIRAARGALDQRSFFTFNENECRAWSIAAGTLAPQAAGVIHSDMERGFIRAEVCAYADLAAAGSMAEAKKDNLVRLEGKNYEVRDGDILTIRFNV